MLTVDEYLHREWRNLRDDMSKQARAFVAGSIHLAGEVGLLTQEQVELWERRVQTCPGHNDEGGRVWCAYGCTFPTGD